MQVVNGNALLSVQWAGVFMVFTGLLLQTFLKAGHHSKKAHGSKRPGSNQPAAAAAAATIGQNGHAAVNGKDKHL